MSSRAFYTAVLPHKFYKIFPNLIKVFFLVYFFALGKQDAHKMNPKAAVACELRCYKESDIEFFPPHIFWHQIYDGNMAPQFLCSFMSVFRGQKNIYPKGFPDFFLLFLSIFNTSVGLFGGIVGHKKCFSMTRLEMLFRRKIRFFHWWSCGS